MSFPPHPAAAHNSGPRYSELPAIRWCDRDVMLSFLALQFLERHLDASANEVSLGRWRRPASILARSLLQPRNQRWFQLESFWYGFFALDQHVYLSVPSA